MADDGEETVFGLVELFEQSVPIDSVAITPEGCAGLGNGSIIISATGGSGQLGYSLDGGGNYQFSNVFNNLSADTCEIIVKLFGIPAICEKTTTATVEAGGTSQTWWQDTDNDGYHNGVSLESCSPPPGFSNSALPNDCNDNNVAINPGAAEICNGIDDNCDGKIDEGTTGGLTYTGNLAFSTQSSVDGFSQCYAIIDGHLTISGAGINDLSNLGNLQEVTGNLNIQYTGLEDLEGLDTLSEVGGSLTIYFNSNLTSLNGLDSLATVGGSFFMYYNFLLSNCCAIDGLLENGGISASTVIFYNAAGSHCNSASAIMAACPLAPPLIGNHTGTAVMGEPFSPREDKKIRIYPNPASKGVLI